MSNKDDLMERKSEIIMQMNKQREEIQLAFRERDVAHALHNAQGAIIHAATLAAQSYMNQVRFCDEKLSNLHARHADLSRLLHELEEEDNAGN